MKTYQNTGSRAAKPGGKTGCGCQHANKANAEFEEEMPNFSQYTEAELESEARPFDGSSVPPAAKAQLARRQEGAAVTAAIAAGQTNENWLADMIFHHRYPRRQGRPIDRNEPNYATLSQEWIDIRGSRVRPRLASSMAKVKRYFCTDANLQQTSDRIGRAITAEEARLEMEKAVKTAIVLGLQTAYALRAFRRKSNISQIFGQAFGYCPEHMPREWAAKKPKWKDFGELVAVRLESAAKILKDNWIRYYCSCRPFNDPQTCHDDVNACAQPSTSKICVSGGFWDYFRNQDTVNMGRVLLHEALHLYFSFLPHEGGIASIRCYETIVMKYHGVAVPAYIARLCPDKPRGCAVA